MHKSMLIGLSILTISLPISLGACSSPSAGDDDTDTVGDDDTATGDDDTSSGDDDTNSGDDDTSSGDDDTSSGDDDTSSGDDDTSSSASNDTTDAIWAEIGGDAQGYRSYAQFPNATDPMDSASHNSVVEAYINDVVATAMNETWTGSLPDGALIVKESWSTWDDVGGTPAGITVMKKIDGFDPENANWYWVNFGGDGSVSASGKVDGCVSCHAIAADNDYVYLYDFSGGS